MGLSYNDLYLKIDSAKMSRNLYKEKTNVFPYYILKFILINFHSEFMIWCDNNNTNIFNFTDSNRNLNLFFDFIHQYHDDQKLHKTLSVVYNFANELQNKSINQKEKRNLLNNMRMTICDFI